MGDTHTVVLFGVAVLVAGLVGLLAVLGGIPGRSTTSSSPSSIETASIQEVDESIRRVLTDFGRAFPSDSGSPRELADEVVRVLIRHGAASRASTMSPPG